MSVCLPNPYDSTTKAAEEADAEAGTNILAFGDQTGYIPPPQ